MTKHKAIKNHLWYYVHLNGLRKKYTDLIGYTLCNKIYYEVVQPGYLVMGKGIAEQLLQLLMKQ